MKLEFGELELAGLAREEAASYVEEVRLICERKLAAKFGDAPIEVDISSLEIGVRESESPDRTAERLYLAIVSKIAAKRLSEAAPDLVANLRRITSEVFQNGLGSKVAKDVKTDVDARIDRNLSAEADALARETNAIVRFFKHGLWGSRDVLDDRIDAFVEDLEEYAGTRGVELEVREASGVPQVSPVPDNPFSIVYEKDEAVHKGRHEAVHVLQTAQARVTVLEQLLARRERLGMGRGSVQDLSPAELAEAELRLDKLESSVGNYPAFELSASKVGGTGGRKVSLPTRYAAGLKRTSGMIASGLSSADTSMSYYASFGLHAIPTMPLADAMCGLSPFISGSASVQKVWAGGMMASIATACALAATATTGGAAAIGIALLPFLATPWMTVKRKFKVDA